MKVTREDVVKHLNRKVYNTLVAVMLNHMKPGEIKGKTEWNLILTIDGREINMQKFFDDFQKQIDEELTRDSVKRAKEIVEGKFSDTISKLYDVESEIKSKFPEVFEE